MRLLLIFPGIRCLKTGSSLEGEEGSNLDTESLTVVQTRHVKGKSNIVIETFFEQQVTTWQNSL